MEISLFHRLSGAWLGYQTAIAQFPSLATSTAIAPQLWQGFCTGKPEGVVLNAVRVWPACPLETSLSLLPLLLFYHEDYRYLSDRLFQLSLPREHWTIITTLGEWLGAILIEGIHPERLLAWFEERSPAMLADTKFLHDLYQQYLPWQQLQRTMTNLPTDTDLAYPDHLQQYLQLYGACLWSQGNVQLCEKLLAPCSPVVQAWGFVLMGSLRGDRHCTSRTLNRTTLKQIQQEILLFWRCWSGLPLENQLQLEELPIIAPATSLKYRPSLNLISQRHISRLSP